MALDQFHHGVRVVEVNEGTRTIRTVATAVIGIICTGSDADAAYFPLNKPVLIANLPAAIAKAGSTGNLKRSLQTIYDTVNTIVIAVRVADGADAAGDVLQDHLAPQHFLGMGRDRARNGVGRTARAPLDNALNVLFRIFGQRRHGCQTQRDHRAKYGFKHETPSRLYLWPGSSAGACG